MADTRSTDMSPPMEPPTATGSSGHGAIGERAYATLKAKILNNEFPPGYQALEQEVAEMLGISRTPVREILTRLQDEGLIQRLPRRGFRIMPLTPKDISELGDVLGCLEVRAVELLTESRPAPDSEVLNVLEATNARAREALSRGDRAEWADADHAFHHAILHYCGNQHLLRTGLHTWEQFHRADIVTLRIRPEPVNSPAEHAGIIEAIRAHDTRKAAKLLAQHRKNGRATILASLTQAGLKHL